jgi:hypothetical protein
MKFTYYSNYLDDVFVARCMDIPVLGISANCKESLALNASFARAVVDPCKTLISGGCLLCFNAIEGKCAKV